MQDRIRVVDTSVTTVSVEIKTLTIGRKQMTLAVFRQLLQEQVISADFTKFKGSVWGHVNYFWGDCQEAGHLHIIWQNGHELRRACVDKHYQGAFKLTRTTELNAALVEYKLTKDQATAAGYYRVPTNPNVCEWCDEFYDKFLTHVRIQNAYDGSVQLEGRCEHESVKTDTKLWDYIAGFRKEKQSL